MTHQAERRTTIKRKIHLKKQEMPSYNRKNIIAILLLALLPGLLLLPGCTTRAVPPAPALPELKAAAQDTTAGRHPPAAKSQRPARQPERKTLEAEQKKPSPLKAKFKELSPLDAQRISASFVEESYRHIFQILAKAAGLNLVLAPELETLIGTHRLTAEYQEIQVRTILDAICAIFNVAWQEKHSTLFIEPYVSKTIHLDFLSKITQSSFKVGGDVLGGSNSSGDIVSPLTGSFEIAGEVADTVTDIYKNIEETVGKRLESDGEFLLNRQTGLLMIRCRPRLAAEIEDYLEVLRKKYSKQVLIEAQIIEVSLKEGRQMGIDWHNFNIYTGTEPLTEATQTLVNFATGNSSRNPVYSIGIDSPDYILSGVFSALQKYGNLKILSNPRIKAMNGQSAAISAGQSVSYLKSLSKTTEGTGDDRKVEISTEIGAIFDGILLGVTPVIREDNSVSLHIVPIKSELVSLGHESLGAVDAYSVAFPIVNLREISTIVNVRPHNIVVLGGLIMEREHDDESGLPLLGDLPYIGRLFKKKATSREKVELVVILKIDVIE